MYFGRHMLAREQRLEEGICATRVLGPGGQSPDQRQQRLRTAGSGRHGLLRKRDRVVYLGAAEIDERELDSRFRGGRVARERFNERSPGVLPLAKCELRFPEREIPVLRLVVRGDRLFGETQRVDGISARQK